MGWKARSVINKLRDMINNEYINSLLLEPTDNKEDESDKNDNLLNLTREYINTIKMK